MPTNLSGVHFKITGILLHMAIYYLFLLNAILAQAK